MGKREQKGAGMAATTASPSWYLLVFTAMGFFLTTFAAIVSHMPRVPRQRGLIAVMVIAALASLTTLIMTQVQEGSKAVYDLLGGVLLLAIAAGVADLFYYVQARRAKLAGANWSLYVALALFVFGALGLIANYGATG